MQGYQDASEITPALALDIGGTFIKRGFVSADGACSLLSPVPVDSSGARDAILRSLRLALDVPPCEDEHPLRLAICLPGPFDYRNGLFCSDHKFGALKGLSAQQFLPQASRGSPVTFCHDAIAFLAGERRSGAARTASCCLGVTIGTGIGVACYQDGVYLADAAGSPAKSVSVWSRPYREGIAEDYASARGLVAAFRELGGSGDAAGISAAAQEGDQRAVAAFIRFGDDLGRILQPVCELMRPEILVLGGQVAKSLSWFLPALWDVLRKTVPDCRVLTSYLDAKAPLIGAASLRFCS